MTEGSNCNICGSEIFLPGPGGRMARSGKLPCCAGCGSLERHRGLRALLDPLPGAFFANRRALQFAPERAPDRALDPAWFASFEEYIVPGPLVSSIAHTPSPDRSATSSHSSPFTPITRLSSRLVRDPAVTATLFLHLQIRGSPVTQGNL